MSPTAIYTNPLKSDLLSETPTSFVTQCLANREYQFSQVLALANKWWKQLQQQKLSMQLPFTCQSLVALRSSESFYWDKWWSVGCPEGCKAFL